MFSSNLIFSLKLWTAIRLERKNKVTNRIAMDHFGTPEDVGHAALYLCSDTARYVTGLVLPVDGGAVVSF